MFPNFDRDVVKGHNRTDGVAPEAESSRFQPLDLPLHPLSISGVLLQRRTHLKMNIVRRECLAPIDHYKASSLDSHPLA